MLPRRLNNPTHQSKTEEEHIVHVKDRILERFDLNISTEEYYELLNLVKSNAKQLYRLNTHNSVKSIEFKGKKMLVVYGCGSENRELPSRIKTVLYPDAEYPVPGELLRQGVARKDFTQQIKDTVNEMVMFAQDIMPNVTPRELYTNPKYDKLHPAFKKTVKHISSGIKPVRLDTLLSVACSIVIQKYDKNIVDGTE
jgi:hypothetical protein